MKQKLFLVTETSKHEITEITRMNNDMGLRAIVNGESYFTRLEDLISMLYGRGVSRIVTEEVIEP